MWGKSKKEDCKMNINNMQIFALEQILEIIKLDKKVNIKKDLFSDIAFIEKGLSNSGLDGKEQEVVIKARVNQSMFRKQLLDRYKKCCLCSASNPDLLIASHIKPWCESEPNQKLDIENGFLLCPNHDKLFDSGLISFDNDGRIIISDKLSEADREAFGVNKNMVIELTDANKKYLKHHRQKRFKNR